MCTAPNPATDRGQAPPCLLLRSFQVHNPDQAGTPRRGGAREERWSCGSLFLVSACTIWFLAGFLPACQECTVAGPATGHGQTAPVCCSAPPGCPAQSKQTCHGGVGQERSDSCMVPCFQSLPAPPWFPCRVPSGSAGPRLKCSSGGTGCAGSAQPLLHSPSPLVLGHNSVCGHNQSRVGG